MSLPVLDLELVKAFVAVADHRSFTRAAAVLNRTQSAVSMQIKRLEDRLGVALFHRTKVTVDLSPAGEGLLGYARRLLVLNDEAVGRLREHKVEGVVRLGVMDDYGTFVVPPLLASFIAGYPRIHIEMETGLTATWRSASATPSMSSSRCILRAVAAASSCGASRPSGPREASNTVEAQDPLPVALYPQGCLFRKWAMEALDAAKRPWRLAFVSHSLAAVESIAAQGLAVTVVKSGTFPPKLRPLSDRDGMPAIARGRYLPATGPRTCRAQGHCWRTISSPPWRSRPDRSQTLTRPPSPPPAP
ncbi:MAG: LysR family transcriptional regulator [Acetobacteraceae bacterium]